MKNFTFLLLIIFVVQLSLIAQNEPVKPEKKPETKNEEVLKIDTNLVVVPVSVRSRKGGFITNLSKENFRIYEDGVEQEVANFETPDKPFTVALLLDKSDSAELKVIEIQDAAIAFTEQLHPNESVMIVSFDRYIRLFTEPSSDRKTLFESIRKTKTGGGTSIYDTVEQVFKRLNKIAGRKAIVIFSDGMDTTSIQATFESTLRLADESSSLIYPIQYNTYRDLMAKQAAANSSGNTVGSYNQTSTGESVEKAFERGTRYLQMLASNSGGRFYYADSIKNLKQSFFQISEELRRQYSLSYYPKNETSGKKKRKIKVTVDISGGVVKSRDSYVYGTKNQ